METVGPDHEVEPLRAAPFEHHVDARTVWMKTRDRVIEPELGDTAGRVDQRRAQVSARHLELPIAATGRDTGHPPPNRVNEHELADLRGQILQPHQET